MAVDNLELLQSIQNQKCALVLGHNACLTADGRTTFSKKISSKLQGSDKPVYYYAHDDLYYIELNADRTWASTQIDNEISFAQIDLNNPGFFAPLYDILTEIPFHLIINLSSDNFLSEWMKHKGLKPQLISFSTGEVAKSFERPTPAKPLIYNLLGEAQKAESLVLTQEDFFRYLSEVFTNPKKLEDLRCELRNVNHILFIGVPLERWYVKLIMLLFEINSNSRYISVATYPQKDTMFGVEESKVEVKELQDIKDFCYKHFKIKFVENNFLDFLRALHKDAGIEAMKANPIIRLRKNGPSHSANITDAKRQIAIVYANETQPIKIVDNIINKLESKKYQVLNEKISISYRGSISEFIEKLSSNKVIVLILSDRFLKQKESMHIALEIEKYKNFSDRIFPIILNDANIYEVLTRLKYIKHWEDKIEELNQSIRELQNMSYLKSINEELDRYNDIRHFIDEFISIVADMNVLTPDIHQDEDFTTLLTAIDNAFTVDQ